MNEFQFLFFFIFYFFLTHCLTMIDGKNLSLLQIPLAFLTGERQLHFPRYKPNHNQLAFTKDRRIRTIANGHYFSMNGFVSSIFVFMVFTITIVSSSYNFVTMHKYRTVFMHHVAFLGETNSHRYKFLHKDWGFRTRLITGLIIIKRFQFLSLKIDNKNMFLINY